jgi:hypothetical protein
MMRRDCLFYFYWYLCNYWSSLFKLSFHNIKVTCFMEITPRTWWMFACWLCVLWKYFVLQFSTFYVKVSINGRCFVPVARHTFSLVLTERYENSIGVIRSRKSKKVRHVNGQNKKDKWKNNDLQNTTQKT